MLMGIVLPMNVVSLFALLAPASSFFGWINYGVAVCAAFAALCLWLFIPPDTPRTTFDTAASLQH